MKNKIEERQKEGSISIFGTGVKAIAQITLETNFLLQKMDKVFHMSSNDSIAKYLDSIGCEEVNLNYLYAEGNQRKNVYKKISEIIVSKVSTNKIDCAFLTTGNPVFLNTIVRYICDLAKAKGVPVNIYPGVSSIDSILVDIRLPVGLTGLQCYECTHFIKFQPHIDIRVPLLLFQPGVIEDFKIRRKIAGNISGIQKLKNHLINEYGVSQMWYLINSANGNDSFAIYAKGTMEEMEEKADFFNRGTLLIPGDWKLKF